MRVLVVNVGSTSIKFDIFDTVKNDSFFSGEIKNLLTEPLLKLNYGLKNVEKTLPIKTHQEAIPYINAYISSLSLDFDAIGFRVVHGGDFNTHQLLDDAVLTKLISFNGLAPLHNPITVDVINTYRASTNKPICLIFDTVYYRTLPAMSYTYPIPKEWRDMGVRKYGFHGINHEYLYERVNEIDNAKRVITCHLGAGSSVTATLNGKPIDTSMGFTPMSGVMMNTRSGDIDPNIINFLMQNTNLTVEQISETLAKESGWKALTGYIDMKELEIAALGGNKDCALALNIYVKKVLEFISSYYVFLGGADALVFSGGVGENSKILRKLIIGGLSSLGMQIDETLNNSDETEKKINSMGTPIYVIKSNESKMIAKYTERTIKGITNENIQTNSQGN